MTGSEEESALSPLADALRDLVAASRRARVGIDELREQAHRVDLSFAGSPEARERLAEAIGELEAAGVVTVPSGARLWDRHITPPLPAYVQRVRSVANGEDHAEPEEPPPVWHARLSWVPAFLDRERPSRTERDLLMSVQRFLGQGPASRTVPLRERSLELLGDEKALDSLVRGRLFTAEGRLTLELLAAERVAPPLAVADGGAGADILIVENYASYVSLSRALRGHPGVGQVVWGAGNQVAQLLPQFGPVTGRLLYFGDLDVRGLEIGAAASAVSRDLGLPEASPCGHLYELLLTHGTMARTGTRPPSRSRVEEAVAWLPERLRDRARFLLSAGSRMAQEAVGADVLATLTLPNPLR